MPRLRDFNRVRLASRGTLSSLEVDTRHGMPPEERHQIRQKVNEFQNYCDEVRGPSRYDPLPVMPTPPSSYHTTQAPTPAPPLRRWL